jgi:mannose-6-phosphate isomerase-like protein (cupin superfamily)
MSAPALVHDPLSATSLDLGAVRQLLETSGGGLQTVHVEAAFGIRVEVLNSPGPGTVRVERGDSLYVVLDGDGFLGHVDGDPIALTRGQAAVVPAGSRHVLFGNPRLSLLVVAAPGRIPVGALGLCRSP